MHTLLSWLITGYQTLEKSYMRILASNKGNTLFDLIPLVAASVTYNTYCWSGLHMHTLLSWLITRYQTLEQSGMRILASNKGNTLLDLIPLVGASVTYNTYCWSGLHTHTLLSWLVHDTNRWSSQVCATSCNSSPSAAYPVAITFCGFDILLSATRY